VDSQVNWICECAEWCVIHVEIPTEVAQRITGQGWYLISDVCQHGPAPDDRLEETHPGFKLYSNPSLQRRPMSKGPGNVQEFMKNWLPAIRKSITRVSSRTSRRS
jgi:hypothetical protein